MTYKGTVKNGVVILPPEAKLPEGSEVEVAPMPSSEQGNCSSGKYPTLFEMFQDFVGVCEGPPDLARNHDYYAHGAPKR